MKGLGFIFLVLAVWSMAITRPAHADMDCKIYSAPLPSKQITCDFELNQWLKTNKSSCDPSYYCKDGRDAVVKSVGSFHSSGSGTMEFKFDDYRGHQQTFSQPIPDDDKKPECNSVFRIFDSDGDKNTLFSCFDGGKWSSQRYLFPNGCAAESIASGSPIPKKGSEAIFGVDENTQVYVLGPNPNSPVPGANAELLFVGTDCGKVIKSSK